MELCIDCKYFNKLYTIDRENKYCCMNLYETEKGSIIQVNPTDFCEEFERKKEDGEIR